VIDETEAALVHRIDAMYLAGLGVSRIARTLNADGIPTTSARRGMNRRAGQWQPRPILDLLDNPCYVGLVRFKGETFPGLHEPIRDEETWKAIQELRVARRVRPPRGPQPARHILTRGLARCGRCGTGMSARRVNVGDYYVCSRRHTHGPEACDQPYLRRETVDGLLLGYFLETVHDRDRSVEALAVEARRAIADARDLAAAAELTVAKADDAVARAERSFLDGTVSPEAFDRMLAAAAEARAGAEAQATHHRRYAERLDAEVSLADAHRLHADRIVDLIYTVAGRLQGAESVDALRAAVAQSFTGFVVHADADEVRLVPQLRGELARVGLPYSEGESSAPSAHIEGRLVQAVLGPIVGSRT
jgi:hypothetical protein